MSQSPSASPTTPATTSASPPAASVVAPAAPGFGALLKRYRRAAGLTQEQLAERAGYSVGHISKLESAVRHPVAATVDLLADALALSDAEQAALRRAARAPASQARGIAWRPARAEPRLIDRVAEMERIEQHLGEWAPPLLLLTGETGIGTSRLLTEAARQGAGGGWTVLEGTCRRSATSPFDPLLTALASAVRGQEVDRLRAALRGCSWLVRLLPELAESGACPLPVWALPAEQERRLMFDAVERFLGNVAGPTGTLLVLDNLQWARADALDLLSALVQGVAQSFLKIIAACSPGAVRPPTLLGNLVADLAAEGLIAVESVGPLPPDAAARLFDTTLKESGPARAALRADAISKSGGVPFALVSYAHWLRTARSAELGEGDPLGVPWDLTQMTRQRVAALSEVAQAIVRIAAVADGDDPRDLLLAVAERLGWSEAEALDGLDTACQVGVLVERDGALYAFAQDFIQEVVADQLGTAQRAHLHHEIAEVLARQSGSTRAEALAAHFLEAGAPREASVYLHRAGTRATALHAYTAAEQCYRTLVDQHDQQDPNASDRESAHAHEQLGVVLIEQGRYAEALTELDRALVGHRAKGDRDAAGRTIARLGWGYLLASEVELGLARLEHEAAETSDLSDQGRALVSVALARLNAAAAQHERQLACAEQAVAFARLANHAPLLALAESERSKALAMTGQLDESLRVLEHAAIPLHAAAGDLWTQTLALDRAAQGHLARGEFATAEACITRGLALARLVDDPYLGAALTHTRGVLHYHRGAWRRARGDLLQARIVLRAGSMPSQAARAAVWLGRLELATGLRDRAETDLHWGVVLAERTGDVPALAVAYSALAEQALVAGNADQAHTLLAPLLARARDNETDLTEALALLGWACVERGQMEQGMAHVTRSIVRAAAQGQRCALVDALRIRALLVGRQQRQWGDAVAGCTEALNVASALPLPYAEAKVRLVYGDLLQQYGEAEQAEVQHAAARHLLDSLGERLYAVCLERATTSAAAASI